MLKNYLTLAWKVLQRRKVFTAISLFGTSFTLVVLTVAVALFDHTLSPMPPEVNLSRTLVMSRARMQGDGNTWQSPPGYRLIHDYARNLPGIELMTVQTEGSLATSFVQGRKIESTLKHTDAEFWRLYQFSFLEGSPYGAADVTSARLVVVINETSRKRFFGDESAIGQLHRRRWAALPGHRRRQGRAVAAHALGRSVRAADDAEVQGVGRGISRQLHASLPAGPQCPRRGRAGRAGVAPVDVEVARQVAVEDAVGHARDALRGHGPQPLSRARPTSPARTAVS